MWSDKGPSSHKKLELLRLSAGKRLCNLLNSVIELEMNFISDKQICLG